MKTKIKWRLANRPTPSEVIQLHSSGLLNKDEAREILLTEETEEERDKESLKSEVKFLREIVEKLSKGNTSTVIETIRYVDRPYRQYGWYKPYEVWCGTGNTTTGGSLIGTGTTTINAGSSLGVLNTNSSFSAINTF